MLPDTQKKLTNLLDILLNEFRNWKSFLSMCLFVIRRISKKLSRNCFFALKKMANLDESRQNMLENDGFSWKLLKLLKLKVAAT